MEEGFGSRFAMFAGSGNVMLVTDFGIATLMGVLTVGNELATETKRNIGIY